MAFNPFEILEISPTLDYDTIKAAYKKAALKWHPDKTGGTTTEQFKQVVKAWEALREESSRNEYFTGQSTRPAYARPFPSSPAPSTSVHHNFTRKTSDSPTDALATFGEKVRIFFPMDINKKPVDPAIIERSKWYGIAVVDRSEVLKTVLIDFEMIARRITNVLKLQMQQVGVDLQEAKEIREQHTWHKVAQGYYAVEIWVNVADLDPRITEKDMIGDPGILSLRDRKSFFVLKQNTQISSVDIVGMKLVYDYIDRGHSIVTDCTNIIVNPLQQSIPIAASASAPSIAFTSHIEIKDSLGRPIPVDYGKAMVIRSLRNLCQKICNSKLDSAFKKMLVCINSHSNTIAFTQCCEIARIYLDKKFVLLRHDTKNILEILLRLNALLMTLGNYLNKEGFEEIQSFDERCKLYIQARGGDSPTLAGAASAPSIEFFKPREDHSSA